MKDKTTKLKWRYAGHVARINDIRSTKILLECGPNGDTSRADHRCDGFTENRTQFNASCITQTILGAYGRGLCSALDERSWSIMMIMYEYEKQDRNT